MEAFMGKWKMDYSACEGYDEFMAAEVQLKSIKCNNICSWNVIYR